ncbi:DNA translocase FtsK [Pseudomonas fluorescens]|uniref:DNA translocase FtsK n=1 Tax=Pseudomonas TaxID=286 RepID=UPI000762D9EB|nr:MULTISPECIES: DNA translocase FtsK [Pseudomonas]KWV82545.1 DNA translocase FtsK [Pseudomonas fluorescens]MBW9238318.1 DNA translocase FtsK [Pseudomonas carnis]
MKTEHRDIIERAKQMDLPPSYIAHELLVHDLVNMVLFEVKNIHSPWAKLNEGCQQEVIDRATKSATEAAHTAINIISSRNVEVVEVKVIDAKFKEKAITITANIDANDPNGGALAKVPGKMCLLVLAPTDYDDGLDFIQPDRDQPDLPLHVSDLTGSLFAGGSGPDEPEGDDVFVGDDQDPLYVEAVLFVTETRRVSISAVQRHLKVGYNRAARMIQWMETQGIVTEMDTNGGRELIATTSPATGGGVDRPMPEELGKEFGEFTYEDAAQLIVLKAPKGHFEASWIQSRLAIDSDKAATLLMRLLDNGVIKLEKEGETALEHSYYVIATLADVT